MNLRREAGVLSVVLVALWVLGCGSNQSSQTTGGDKPTPPAAAPTGSPQATAPAKPDETHVDYTLTTAEYLAEFEKSGKDVVRKKYAGKLIEVTGVIQVLDRRRVTTSLYLGQTAEGPRVFDCGLTESSMHPYSVAQPGQTVKIRGKGLMVDEKVLVLSSCEIVSVTGMGPATVDATELAKEFKARKKAYQEKYKVGSYLIVIGEVASTRPVGAVGYTLVVLTQEADGVEVNCFFENAHPADKEQNAKIAKGQKVKILGQRASDNVVGCAFDKCVLLDEKK